MINFSDDDGTNKASCSRKKIDYGGADGSISLTDTIALDYWIHQETKGEDEAPYGELNKERCKDNSPTNSILNLESCLQVIIDGVIASVIH